MASTEPNGSTFPKIPPPPTSSGPSEPTSSNNKRLQQTQAKVNEVVDIMRVNVEKVLERDTKLSELDNRADALQQGASQFEQSATKLKRKQWWNNMKMMIIMGVIAIVILIILIAFNRHGGCVTYTDEEMEKQSSLKEIDKSMAEK